MKTLGYLFVAGVLLAFAMNQTNTTTCSTNTCEIDNATTIVAENQPWRGNEGYIKE